MRSPCFHFGLPLGLLLAPLVAPLIFTSPAEAQMVGPCCVREGETHPPDERRPGGGPIFVPAEVKRPDERALEASAEAPVTADAPLVDAIGIPLSARRGVSEPEFVPFVGNADPAPVSSGSESFPGCCQAEGEAHPPDRHPEEDPRIPVSAKVKNRIERALKVMAADYPIPHETPLVNAISIPLSAQRGVSEPEFRPVTAEPTAPDPIGQRPGVDDHGAPCCTAAEPGYPNRTRVTADPRRSWLNAFKANAEEVLAVLAILLAVGFWLRAHRRPSRLELEPLPTWRPLPDELPRPDAAPLPLPLLEPEVVQAKARKAARELDPV